MIMTWLYFLLILTFTASTISDSNEFQIKSNEALQFLLRARRTLFHPGKTKCEEQKREASKAYEEKCTVLGKRFCPKLSAWKEFQQWEIGGGYESKRNPLPTQPPAPHINTMRTHQTRLYTPATLRTYKTPMYGPVTNRPKDRMPNHRNDFAIPDPNED
ncbi:unnamed protein product [Rotaria socialis]|uniref:Uncharacterized protein n=1 Tax=Rotaria socialis TaxID=392032 RepID=A0A817V7F7_9BILA|nr:unnamed protein product [Rotaria socialis]CAF3249913.1 unnamed protein product [Rotaria socialis]CAF3338623.1 unnamed protein product [Rotaria socialis]CAF4115865.1 unnamed protein product [Rotaria socialis]CAF4136050.1 unnamed protein product [Rotaria socialis]